ncbi:hypothetical protein GA0061098_1008104 [Bradyrhizobium shewense]|uniref:Uncharacterized protein n=1 Tax=Bradyrhizobium shewense TaxID=1761772 RepID=A0A1C3WJK5_9BRAD|nr:hypothetical protein GA0061098_1008104 [Bradyrhizobium shewense]
MRLVANSGGAAPNLVRSDCGQAASLRTLAHEAKGLGAVVPDFCPKAPHLSTFGNAAKPLSAFHPHDRGKA